MHQIFGGFYNHKAYGWDDKEDPSMFDEVFEGGQCPRVMSVECWDMACSFVFENVELMAIWHE